MQFRRRGGGRGSDAPHRPDRTEDKPGGGVATLPEAKPQATRAVRTSLRQEAIMPIAHPALHQRPAPANWHTRPSRPGKRDAGRRPPRSPRPTRNSSWSRARRERHLSNPRPGKPAGTRPDRIGLGRGSENAAREVDDTTVITNDAKPFGETVAGEDHVQNGCP